MKQFFKYFVPLFVCLFVIIYAVTSYTASPAKPAPMIDGKTPIVPFTSASNPSVDGINGAFTLVTGAAIANPNLSLDAKSSKDCASCHFKESVNYHAGGHGKGTVKIAQLTAPSCMKCHDTKTFDNKSDIDSLIAYAVPESMKEAKAGAALVTCISCHKSDGDHYTTVTFTTKDCGSCHDMPKDCDAYNRNPLNSSLLADFDASTHAKTADSHFVGAADEHGLVGEADGKKFFVSSGNCLSCHENASFKKYYAQDQLYVDADGNKYFKSFTDNNTTAFTESGIGPKAFGLTLVEDENSMPGITCATCHDSHNGGLSRKDVAVTYDSTGKDLEVMVNSVVTDANGVRTRTSVPNKIEKPVTAFSAEFNLCTACHPVELDYNWDANTERFSYTLSRSVHDNATGVTDLNDLTQRTATLVDGKTDISNANLFDYKNRQGAHVEYVGGLFSILPGSSNGVLALEKDRTFIDTHFKGVFVSEVYEKNGIAYVKTREESAGYNINAAAKRACTSCHDPHLNSKFGTNKIEMTISNIPAMITASNSGDTERAVTTSTTWASSGHADYTKETFNKDDFKVECMRCHSGYEAAKYFEGVDAETLDNATSMIFRTSGEAVTCITCHSLNKRKDGKIDLGDVREWREDTFKFSWATESFADPKKDVISKDDLEKIGDSTLCFSCHDGVKTARSVNMLPDDSEWFTKPFDRKEVKAHYGSAASVMWGNAAYEFPGKEYYQSKAPIHGVNTGEKSGGHITPEAFAAKNKGTLAGCTDCHDFYNGNHSGEAYIKGIDENGKEVMTGIIMNKHRIKAGCNQDGCHGEDGTQHASKAQGNMDSYKIALDDIIKQYEKAFNLKLETKAKKFVYADNVGAEFVSWGTGEPARNLYGAARNIYLLASMDTAAYAHNPIYTRQIMWDLMEFANGEFSNGAKFFIGEWRR